MIRRCAVAVLVSAAVANPCCAQVVHRVGAGAFATIQAAIDAAAPFDIVQIDAGVYGGFTVGKPLTIANAPSALVQIVATTPIAIALPLAGRVHLGGLDVDARAITIAGGNVSAERCTIRTVTGVQLTGGFLALRWSSVWASAGSAVHAHAAHVHASDSTFGTAVGSSAAGPLRGALALSGACACSLSGCSLFGAWPRFASLPDPTPALQLFGIDPSGERVWLDDCTLVGGFDALGNLGPSLAAPANATPVRLHRCDTFGAVLGAVAQAPVVGLRTAFDMQIGAPFTTTMRGDPGQLLLFYGGIEIFGPVPIAEVVQPALGFANAVILGVAPGDANGEAEFTFTVPNQPALRHVATWWRGLDVTQMPWQATPAFAAIVQ